MKTLIGAVALFFALVSNGQTNSDPLIHTSTGPIIGQSLESTFAFKGIPFAQPPVGSLRWRPTQPAQPWSEPLQAKEFGQPCIQPRFPEEGEPYGSEDCLTLNVWRPKRLSIAPLPVVVFVHGGANSVGSTSELIGKELRIYDGANLSNLANVVVVTVQYRLGIFGFMAHPELSKESGYSASGNYALMDIIEALKWVNANANAFGGDENNITLMGESAGAMNALSLVASPMARGLFQRVVLESTFMPDIPLAKAEFQGVKYQEQFGCKNGPAVIACLRDMDATKIVKMVSPSPDKLAYFNSVVDGYVLEKPVLEAITDAPSIPVLIGTNLDEMRTLASVLIDRVKTREQFDQTLLQLFGKENVSKITVAYPVGRLTMLQLKMEEILADAFLHCPTRQLAQKFSKRNPNTWRYVFSHRFDHPAYWIMGAGHGLELPFVLHNHLSKMTKREKQLSADMVAYWADFFRTGNPNGDSRPSWAPFQREEYMDLRLDLESKSAFRKDHCDLWSRIHVDRVQ